MRLKLPKQSHSGNAIHCGHFPKTAFQGQGKCWAPLLPFIPLLNLRICAKGGERGREGDEIGTRRVVSIPLGEASTEHHGSCKGCSLNASCGGQPHAQEYPFPVPASSPIISRAPSKATPNLKNIQ